MQMKCYSVTTRKKKFDRPEIRTRNLLISSQICYRVATES